MTQPETSDPLLTLAPEAQKLLFTNARTANSFTEEPVSDEQLRAITDLAKWPPTSSNTNPLRILFIRTPMGKERLVPLMNEGNRAKTSSAPAVALLAVDVDFHEKMPELFPARPHAGDRFADDVEERERFARFNGAIQAGYFILAVRAAGLAAGPMLGFDAAAVDAEFFPDQNYKTILVVNVGKPGENPWFPRNPRLKHEDMVQYA
jgi:3-hydroxypropanoate dehydrogenase